MAAQQLREPHWLQTESWLLLLSPALCQPEVTGQQGTSRARWQVTLRSCLKQRPQNVAAQGGTTPHQGAPFRTSTWEGSGGTELRSLSEDSCTGSASDVGLMAAARALHTAPPGASVSTERAAWGPPTFSMRVRYSAALCSRARLGRLLAAFRAAMYRLHWLTRARISSTTVRVSTLSHRASCTAAFLL